jgi:hypothetical protein
MENTTFNVGVPVGTPTDTNATERWCVSLVACRVVIKRPTEARIVRREPRFTEDFSLQAVE